METVLKMQRDTETEYVRAQRIPPVVNSRVI